MKNIYTELDCLVDTRFTTAIKLDPIGLARDLESNRYFTRLTNSIGDIPIDIFNYVYRYRNKNILKVSSPTLLPNFILEYFKEESAVPDSREIRTKNRIFINCYPYDLDNKEKYYLSCMLASKFPLSEIILVYYSNEKLTPSWILNREIDLIIKYDGLKWVDYHILMGNFISSPLNLVTLIVPKIIDNSDSIKLGENIDNKFNIIRDMLMMFIDITFSPVSIFNLINKTTIDDLDKTKDLVREDVSKVDMELMEDVKKNLNTNNINIVQ